MTLEIQLASHRGLGNRLDLRPGAVPPRQLVDHFALDQRRVHVERDEPPVAPEDRVVLKRDVHEPGIGDRDQLRPHRIFVDDRVDC
jgi:hypothetical protein